MARIALVVIALFFSVNLKAQEFEFEESCENIQFAIDAISDNLANLMTTRTPEGGAYATKVLYYDQEGFFQIYELSQVIKEYEPGHPDADQYGFVGYPMMNVSDQMEQLLFWIRMYEYNHCTK